MIERNEHSEGIAWSAASFVAGAIEWYLRHIEQINGVLHTILLLVTIAAAYIGLRKVLKNDP
jgi:hypothetical protein